MRRLPTRIFACALGACLAAPLPARPQPSPDGPLPAPALDLPDLVYYPGPATAGTLDVDIAPGKALPAEVTAIVLAVAPAPADPGTLCASAPIRREVPRARYEAIPAGPAVASLRLQVSGAGVACGREAVVGLCARLRDGTLRAGSRPPSVVTPECGADPADVLTPSGRMRARGPLAIVAWDPSRGAKVASRLRRLRFGRGAAVAITTDGGASVVLGAATPVRVLERHAFAPAGKVRVGEHLLGEDLAGVAVRAVTSLPRSDEVPVFAADWPGTLFLGGVLTSDGRPHAAPAPLPPPWQAPEEVASLVPWSQSYDCQLGADLEVRALPPEVRAIAVVAQRHRRGLPGERVPPDCAAWPRAVELPRAALEAATSVGAHLELELPSGCLAPTDVALCAERADGALTPLGAARMGFGGPTCLAGDTLIATPSGARALVTLAAGDAVLSLDPRTGATVVARVRRLRELAARPTLALTLAGGARLVATGDHLVAKLPGPRFVPARSLRPGDRVVTRAAPAGTPLLDVRDAGPRSVWDLSLGPPHTYFADGVLVHNY